MRIFNLLTFILVTTSIAISQDLAKDTYHVSYSFTNIPGLLSEKGITRRDPSDVIKFEGNYYVWYTKSTKGFSGYDATIWYAVSKDGLAWEEKGEALPRGESGSWDEYSVFTPNILMAIGKCFLYYTGVKPTQGNVDGKFENNSKTDITAIGVAVSLTPNGPFKRITKNPVIEISNQPDAFDSYRVDDACLLFIDNKYWLYYKGRSRTYGSQGPAHTKMGVAFADKPEGPFIKYENNPVISSGHEVMVWPYKKGVMTILSDHGPDGKTLQFAKDGLSFENVGVFGDDYPKAPGAFRIGNFMDSSEKTGGIDWGISMCYGDDSNWPHLLRYEINIEKLRK